MDAQFANCSNSSRVLKDILICACMEANWEWLSNWSRYLQNHVEKGAVPIACGTTANEAFHNQLKKTFKSTVQLHQSTLKLKLHVIQIKKLLAHGSAAFHPTTTQLPEKMVMARVVNASDPWSDFPSTSTDLKDATQRPLLDMRRQLQDKIRNQKKTKKTSDPPKTRKPTVFTKSRSVKLLKTAKPPNLQPAKPMGGSKLLDPARYMKAKPIEPGPVKTKRPIKPEPMKMEGSMKPKPMKTMKKPARPKSMKMARPMKSKPMKTEKPMKSKPMKQARKQFAK